MMRYLPERSSILMDAMFARLLLYAKEDGYRWFNLGAAPLSGLKDHPLASTWNKVGNLLYRHAENFYHFEGLKSFKQKFNPVWSPQYVCTRGGFALPTVLFDITALISGGRLGASGAMRFSSRLVGALVLWALVMVAPASAATDSLPGVFDLPSALPARAIAIIYSGDGGWQDLDKTIGEWMAAQDIHVVGVSTIKAFWTAREPKQVAADIEKLIADADPTGTLPVMLIGYSFGANVLPFAWPHLGAKTQARIRLVALLAPEKETEFHVSVEGWLGIKSGSHAVADAIKTLPPDPVLCVYGEDEVDDTPCTPETLPGMEIVHTPGEHHFDEDYPKLGQTILDAFDARKPGSPEDSPTAE